MLRETHAQSPAGASLPSADAVAPELSEIEGAILKTITYRDLFDFPATLTEIHHYLQGVRCSRDEVAEVLADSDFCRKYLETDGHFYALRGRAGLFALRRTREARAKKLWPKAVSHGAVLASLPFVRMVAVTGSLAVENPSSDADTDFMIVTDAGRMWTVRLLAKVLQLLNGVFSSGELCVNHFVSMRALELDSQSLYVAQEVTQMVPLYGRTTYAALRKANTWTEEYLPNAGDVAKSSWSCSSKSLAVRRIGEFVLRSPIGRAIETWECRRKLEKYNETEFLLGQASRFSAEATGHRRNVKELIEDAFSDRLTGQRVENRSFRILIGQAYHLKRDPKLWRPMQPFPPLGSLYAAAVARSLGHQVRVHDSMLSVYESDWRIALQLNRPDVVLLYEDNFNYLTKMCLATMRDAAMQMIKQAKLQGATVLVCSSDGSDEPEPYLRAGADFIIVGEGEATLADVLRMLSGEGELERRQIPGLAYLSEDGEIVETGRRPVIRNVDELPLPAWDLVDLRRYREVWTRRHGRFSLNLVTTRGCPYHCNWCAKPIWGQRYNARNPADVVTELSYLQSLTDFDYVWFMDDIFGLKPRWIAQFADLLEDSGMKIRFKCLSRPDLLLRNGEIDALARAGCDIVWMGAESGSQKILDAMEKGTTVEDICAASERLRDCGIRVGFFIQFGYPGETRRDILATIRMIRQVMPDELGISVSYPLPGTRFYELVKHQLGQSRHWRDSDDIAMLFKGPFKTSFYRALHRYVHSDLAMRRAWRDLSEPGRRRALAPKKKLRKTGLLLLSAARLGWYSVAMSVTARLPHRGMTALRPGMRPDAAATPTRQSSE